MENTNDNGSNGAQSNEQHSTSRRRFLGMSATSLAGAVAGAGCLGGSDAPEDAFSGDGIVIPYDTVSTVESDNMFMGPSVRGVAENVSGGALSYVGLTFSAYDSSDVKIGQAMVNTNGIAANAKWRFEASSFEDWDGTRLDRLTCDITTH